MESRNAKVRTILKKKMNRCSSTGAHDDRPRSRCGGIHGEVVGLRDDVGIEFDKATPVFERRTQRRILRGDAAELEVGNESAECVRVGVGRNPGKVSGSHDRRLISGVHEGELTVAADSLW
jgi:hypothetical protein